MFLFDAAVPSVIKDDTNDGIVDNGDTILLEERMDLLRLILSTSISLRGDSGHINQRTLIALDMPRFCKVARLTFGIDLPTTAQLNKDNSKPNELLKYALADPFVALWLLQKGEQDNSLQYLIYTYYFPQHVRSATNRLTSEQATSEIINCLLVNSNKRMNYRSHYKTTTSNKCASTALYSKPSTKSSEAIEKSIAEALLCYTAMPRIEIDLQKSNLFEIFHNIEMPSLTILVKR